MLKFSENKYHGITVELANIQIDITAFKTEIEQAIIQFSDKELLWVKVSIDKSEYIPVLAKMDFEFHHCDERHVMLIRKMRPDSFVPTTKNFIVGVGAVVFHNSKLLIIKDFFQPGYKLPGGHIDKGESIKDALVREVAEETGVEVEFESIMGLGHFKNGQFGEANVYLVCTAKAINDTIHVNDSDEIVSAQWMDPQAFFDTPEVNDFNRNIVRAALNNKELKLSDREIKLRFPGEVFF